MSHSLRVVCTICLNLLLLDDFSSYVAAFHHGKGPAEKNIAILSGNATLIGVIGTIM